MFSLFTKAFSPLNVLRTFPSYYYKSLENTSILKFTPLLDVNTKYNESFDSQILLIPNDKNTPHYSRIYDTIFYETAFLKNKNEKKISPLLVPEHQLIVTVVDMDKEKLNYQQLRNLLAEAACSSLQLAKEKGYKKPLIDYVNDYNKTATAEVEGIVQAAKCNLKIDPTFVCQIHEKFLVEELLRKEGVYLKAEAFVVVLIYVIALMMALSMWYIIYEANRNIEPIPIDDTQTVIEKKEERQRIGWINTLTKLSQ